MVARELDRHHRLAVEWMPHALARSDAEPPDRETPTLPEVVRAALVLNLLTEDNLPSYHREVGRAFGTTGAWAPWMHQWTAEESRHGLALRDYLLSAAQVDADELERLRFSVLQRGWDASEKNSLEFLAYVAVQELATRIAHRATGALSEDPVCERLLSRISADENLHMLVYRNLVEAAFDLDSDAMLAALVTELHRFEMPGASAIPSFRETARALAAAGIYNLTLHRDQVVLPLLRHWRVFDRSYGPAGEQAREALVLLLQALDDKVRRQEAVLANTRQRRCPEMLR